MVEILSLATFLAPITSGIVQAIKSAEIIDKRFIPLLAVVIGMFLGAAAFFINIELIERIWAGGISGLASVGLFELGKKTMWKNQ